MLIPLAVESRHTDIAFSRCKSGRVLCSTENVNLSATQTKRHRGRERERERVQVKFVCITTRSEPNKRVNCWRIGYRKSRNPAQSAT